MKFTNSFYLAAGVLAGIGQAQAQQKVVKYSWDNLPQIERPVFKKDTINVTKYGAKGDGITLNTTAINKAILQCSKRGGGVVLIPQGVWLSGPLKLQNNVNLHISRAAILQFTADKSQYKLVEGVYEGRKAVRNESPISGDGLTNIAITGQGVVDGHGEVWRAMSKAAVTEVEWKELIKTGIVSNEGRTWYPSQSYMDGWQNRADSDLKPGKPMADYEKFKDFYRPNLLVLNSCKKVLLQNVTFQNSAAWCLHTILCEQLTFDGVKVQNEPNAQNGDGMDIESCTYVMVENSTLDCGDDAICIKSGKDEEGRKRGKPTAYLVARNNVVYKGHGGFVIGSEMSGGAHDIFVSNCTFIGTDNGLRFKTVRGRGGIVENIYFRNISMHDIKHDAVLFDMYYFTKAPTLAQTNGKVDIPAVDEGTPRFRNFYIDNLTCEGAERGMLIRGLPEMNIQNINISNANITAKRGADVIEAANIKLSNINFKCDSAKPVVYVENSNGLNFSKLTAINRHALFYSINEQRTNNVKVTQGNHTTAATVAEYNYGASTSMVELSK